MKEEKENTKDIETTLKKIFSSENTTISKSMEGKLNDILKTNTGKDIILSEIIKRNVPLLKEPQIGDGFVYQKIIETKEEAFVRKLTSRLPSGIIKFNRPIPINYQPLQDMLINKKFQEADILTQKYLCQLAAIKTSNYKNWLYFTDIQFIPKTELFKIDLLWKTYSKGKFGFSIQKKIWIQYNKKWDKLWEINNWIESDNGTMRRYPQEFNWTIDAPSGHLPLFNQLRGTQTLSYLFKTIDW